MPLHWHPSSTLGCVSVQCLSGRVVVFLGIARGSGERLLGPDRAVQFQPAHQMVAWASSGTVRSRHGCQEAWSAETVVTDPNLYRNVGRQLLPGSDELPIHIIPYEQWASAILDRNIYASLASTPLWIKLVLNILRAVPSAREALLSWLLFVQVQAILYAHDFREFHGRINCIWPWTRQPVGGRPPQWALDLQRQTEYWIAEVVMVSCFWGGRIALGMRGQYPEYTRSPQNVGGEKK